MPEEQEIKIPTPRQIIDFLNKKEVLVLMLILAVIVLIVSGFKLAEVQKCKAKEGIYMEGGKCYVPKDENERQQILEKGYMDTYPKWYFNTSLLFEKNITK